MISWLGGVTLKNLVPFLFKVSIFYLATQFGRNAPSRRILIFGFQVRKGGKQTGKKPDYVNVGATEKYIYIYVYWS